MLKSLDSNWSKSDELTTEISSWSIWFLYLLNILQGYSQCPEALSYDILRQPMQSSWQTGRQESMSSNPCQYLCRISPLVEYWMTPLGLSEYIMLMKVIYATYYDIQTKWEWDKSHQCPNDFHGCTLPWLMGDWPNPDKL